MIPFELVEPTALSDALCQLDPNDTSIRPISGGTAVMLMMKAGVLRPRRLVSLRKIPGLTDITATSDGGLRIGAMTPLALIERSSIVRKACPVLIGALRTLSNIRVRNVATLGGHLAHGDPHTDLPPLLAALGASVTVSGRNGSREVAVGALYRGYLETVLAADELISAVTIPATGSRKAAYLKCTTRSADDWPAVGVAVSLDAEGGVIRDVRIVVSAATDLPTRLQAAEAVLKDSTADARALERAGEAAVGELVIVGDQHGSAPYKRQLARVYIGRAVRAALAA
ncbi:MAG: xanthine dehydrogenase family protein subunit M [Burkholderiales bacterium]